MPNKDSFTFSDKLKRSKSLPLSKRIPSKVGGDGKAKRTLIQRAQRDLPFIIVAAAALLLLPFLSRNGAEGPDLPRVDIPSTDEASHSYGLEGEMLPSGGLTDPSKLWVVPRSGEDTAGVDVNTPGVGGEEATTEPFMGSGSSAGGSEESATAKYGDTAKKSVRKAYQREATKVGSLKNSSTAEARGSSGAGRTLLVGGAASSSGGGAPRAGVRPVALQPMTSAGKGGRSETGEGLYAEAARAMGAMNRGPAKQALFESQLRNVDGSALGNPVGGSPTFGGGSRTGAGGAPSNNVGYKPYLPWWWDFEKQKAMKHWELWNYNFQKALSDSLVKVGTNLFMCLATGSENGSVSKFFGDKGGAADFECIDKKTGQSLAAAGDMSEYTSSSEGSGDNEKKSNNSLDALTQFCKEKKAEGYDVSVEKTTSGKKNMVDVRLRCLGLKYKDTDQYKYLQKTAYSDAYDCIGISESSGIMKFELTAPSQSASIIPGLLKLKKDPSSHMGHYVVAKNMLDSNSQPQVIYIAKGGTLNGVKLKGRIESLNKLKSADFVVTKVVGFTIGNIVEGKIPLLGATIKGKSSDKELASGAPDRIQAQINDLESLGKEERQSLTQYETKKNPDGSFAKVKVEGSDYEARHQKLMDDLVAAKTNIVRTEAISDSAFESTLTRLNADMIAGEFKSEGYVEGQLKLKVQKTCTASTDFYKTKMSNMFHTLRQPSKLTDKIGCDGEPTKYVKLKDSRSFSTTIRNPGACTYAVVVEKSPITKDKYIVKRVVNFQSNYETATVTPSGDDANIYKFDASVGLDEASTIDTSKAELQNGNGWVFWVTNNSCDGVAVKEGDPLPDADTSLIVNGFSVGGQSTGVCRYRWACQEGGCVAKAQGDASADYCVQDGKLYSAFKTSGGLFIRTSETDTNSVDAASAKAAATDEKVAAPFKTFVDSYAEGELNPQCEDCQTKAVAVFEKAGFKCTPICAKLQEKLILEKSKQDATTGVHDYADFMLKLGLKTDVDFGKDDKGNDTAKTAKATALCPVCDPKEPEAVSITNVEKKPECTFNGNATFGTSSYVLKGLDNDKISTFFENCLSPLASKATSAPVPVYVVGFTSYAGDESDNTICKGTYCVPENGQGYSVDLPNSNKILSEDRALSVAQGFIKNIAYINNHLAKPLPLGYRIDFSREGDISSHFSKHTPRTNAEIQAVLSEAENMSNVSSGRVLIQVVTRGYGSLGYSAKSDVPADRQVVISIKSTDKRVAPDNVVPNVVKSSGKKRR